MVLNESTLEETMQNIIKADSDTEHKHKAMDAVLILIIRAEGYGRIADMFGAQEKWYA